jgi:hypothetical protein
VEVVQGAEGEPEGRQGREQRRHAPRR